MASILTIRVTHRFGNDAGARRAALSPPRRQLCAAVRPEGLRRAVEAHMGMDDRDIDALPASDIRRGFRTLPASQDHSRPHGRNAALYAVAARQPGRVHLWRAAARGAALGLSEAQSLRDNIRPVLRHPAD